jgi:hypothetical protein
MHVDKFQLLCVSNYNLLYPYRTLNSKQRRKPYSSLASTCGSPDFLSSVGRSAERKGNHPTADDPGLALVARLIQKVIGTIHSKVRVVHYSIMRSHEPAGYRGTSLAARPGHMVGSQNGLRFRLLFHI